MLLHWVMKAMIQESPSPPFFLIPKLLMLRYLNTSERMKLCVFPQKDKTFRTVKNLFEYMFELLDFLFPSFPFTDRVKREKSSTDGHHIDFRSGLVTSFQLNCNFPIPPPVSAFNSLLKRKEERQTPLRFTLQHQHHQ